MFKNHLPKCPARSHGEPAGYLKVDQLPKRNPEDAIMMLEMWGCTVSTAVRKLHRITSVRQTMTEETPHEVKPTPGRQPSKTWKTKSKSKAARKKTIKIPEVAAEDMDGGTTPGFQVESFIPKQKDIDGFFESSK